MLLVKFFKAVSKLCLRFNFDAIAWSLRRFTIDIPSSSLVLEVGSGGNPYPRSNILLDAYEITRERYLVPLAQDRPTVLGFGENLPFKDDSFDFVIAAHVLEHSTDPEKFLSELQRVAKAGYIEVPDAFFERVNPYRDHRSEITVRNGKLYILKKSGWIEDANLVELYEDRVKEHMTKELMRRRPFDFHVRFFWKGDINFEVVNNDVDANWLPPESVERTIVASLSGRLRNVIRKAVPFLLTQSKRNSTFNVTPLLRCTECKSVHVVRNSTDLYCNTCHTSFPVRGHLIGMNQPKTSGEISSQS